MLLLLLPLLLLLLVPLLQLLVKVLKAARLYRRHHQQTAVAWSTPSQAVAVTPMHWPDGHQASITNMTMPTYCSSSCT